MGRDGDDASQSAIVIAVVWTRPEVFLAHKDALLAHLRDFHLELQRYTPCCATPWRRSERRVWIG